MDPVVLITGVSSGIGKSTAGYLASKGMKVFGTVVESINGIKLHPDGYMTLSMYNQFFLPCELINVV